MTCRNSMTLLHGMLFGGFFLFAAFALLLESLRLWHPHTPTPRTTFGHRAESAYLAVTAALGWLAVMSGTYIVYPWYRATPPSGADLHDYPRSLLLASASTAGLHTIGMEWKEHIAFVAPIAFTAVAWIIGRYPEAIRSAQVRRVLAVFSLAALLSAAVPGVVGALLNKAAPTDSPRSGNVTAAVKQ